MFGPILSIAGKEIRALFQSQIALLFLVLFEISTLFTFFATSKFFARNLADLNPLFEWLPLQLILLVSAISMRSWAEERKSGTLEVLLTLPVRTMDLVLGKFVAGMVLVALALMLTLPLPLTVWMLGPLDWGPVLGGYLGATLLASAYLAIGLCVSARTDNQVLALMTTIALGGLLYLVGTDGIQGLLGVQFGELAGLIGSGSRFESIARGVLDARDLVYYGSITVFFLVLNKYFLDRWRIDAQGAGRVRLWTLQTLVGLVLLNCVLANVWMHPVRALRADLTQNKDFSISPVTRNLLANLDAPLKITGVFSDRSHPKLQPRVPQLAAVLEEYGIASPDNVTVERVDPSKDDDLADRLEEEYGIRPVPMPTADRNETRIVNSWFHVLLTLGDQSEVVSFNDLIEVDASDNGIEVRLRDPEYDITKAIRKVSLNFVSTASLVAKLPKTKLTLYVSEGTLSPTNQQNLGIMRSVVTDIAAMSDEVTLQEIDPTTDPAIGEEIAKRYGVQPTLDLLGGGQIYYLHLVVETEGQAHRVFPRGELTKAEFTQTVEAAFKRIVPGQLKSIAVYTETPQPPAKPDPRQPPPRPDYQYIRQLLGQTLSPVQTDLADGVVPPQVDVLIVGKTGTLPPHKQMAIEQFLMRGGSVVALAGRNRAAWDRNRFVRQKEGESLFEMLAKWGVSVDHGMVLDPSHADFAGPDGRGRILQFGYPYWPVISAQTMNSEHLAVSGLSQITMPWASPITVTPPEGVTSEVLLSSSAQSWLMDSDNIWPDKAFESTNFFPAPVDPKSHVLGVTLTGRFPAFFTENTRPALEGALTAPVAEGRLVVLGSSEMASDLILYTWGRQSPLARVHLNNELFLQNLIDWTQEDTDLLQIRNPGNFSRTLTPLDADTTFQIELANYLLVLLPLPLLYFWSRRRRPVPDLTKGVPS